jgi:hypothetical protein
MTVPIPGVPDSVNHMWPSLPAVMSTGWAFPVGITNIVNAPVVERGAGEGRARRRERGAGVGGDGDGALAVGLVSCCAAAGERLSARAAKGPGPGISHGSIWYQESVRRESVMRAKDLRSRSIHRQGPLLDETEGAASQRCLRSTNSTVNSG